MSLRESLVTRISQDLEDAAEKMIVPTPLRWIETEFLIPETRSDPKLRGKLRLQPYQRDALLEALSTDENGNFKYDIIVWSDIKKSIKSTIAAAVNLYRASFTEFGEFYVVANDLKQADSRVAYYIRRAIQLNPKMGKRYRERGYRITTPGGAFIEAIPIDPSGEAGSNADMITFSELWGANEGAKQKMWAEMTIPPQKHGKAFRWIESYAGFSDESQLLYSLYDLGVKQGELLWPDKKYDVTDGEPTVLELYVNRAARMLCLWNTQPRCPWQTKEYYASESSILLPNQFARIHRNQWVTSTETFVPMEWYDNCRRKQEEWPEYSTPEKKVLAVDGREFLKKGWPMIISLDAATSNDNFGVYLGCRHPLYPDQVMAIYARKWVPSKATGKIDFQGTDADPGPEKVVDKLIEEYNIIEVTYDPYQLHDMATRKRKEGKAWWHEFSQGTDRLKADSQFRDIVRDRRFWHRGDVDLRDQVQNADAKSDEQDSKVRIVKRADNLKIDLAVCASMCCHELLRLNL